MLVRALIQHLQETAPGTARVVVLVDGKAVPVRRARVELQAGDPTPVVVLHLDEPPGR